MKKKNGKSLASSLRELSMLRLNELGDFIKFLVSIESMPPAEKEYYIHNPKYVISNIQPNGIRELYRVSDPHGIIVSQAKVMNLPDMDNPPLKKLAELEVKRIKKLIHELKQFKKQRVWKGK